MATPLTIVVVEDHDLLREAMVAALKGAGHHVLGLICAEDMEDASGIAAPDVYVLDLNLPGEDGISLAKRLRESQPGVGIVILSARVEAYEKIEGYRSGADIYLSKPTSPEELIAAVEAVSRKLHHRGQKQAVGLNTLTMQLLGPGGTVGLTAAETQLLAAFARAPQGTLERFQVAEHLKVLSQEWQPSSSLEVRLTYLRRKLEQAGYKGAIKSIREVGYRLTFMLQVQ
jgi:DNA-binding response OmpR family regulator